MLLEQLTFPGLIQRPISNNVLEKTKVMVFGPVKSRFVQTLVKSVLYVSKKSFTESECYGPFNYYKRVQMLVIDVQEIEQWKLIDQIIVHLKRVKKIICLIPSEHSKMELRYNPVGVKTELSKIFVCHEHVRDFTDFADFHFGIVDSWILKITKLQDSLEQIMEMFKNPDRATKIYTLGMFVGIGVQVHMVKKNQRLQDFVFPEIFPEDNALQSLDSDVSLEPPLSMVPPDLRRFIDFHQEDPFLYQKVGNLFSVLGSHFCSEDQITDIWTPDYWKWSWTVKEFILKNNYT